MIEGGFSVAAFAVFPDPVAVVVADGRPAVGASNPSWVAAFGDGSSILTSAAVANALSRVLDGALERAEATFVGADVDHAIVIVAMPGERPTALVHARVVPRRAVHEDAALLQTMLDCLPVSVTLADGSGNRLFSNAADMVHSQTSDAGVFDALVDATDVAFAREVAGRVLATGAEEIMTSDVQTPHGVRSMFYHVIAVDGSRPKEKLLLFVGRDVSEQLRAERDVREQQDFIRQIIDSDPNLIFVKDVRGNCLLVNQAAAAVLGKTPDEIVGQCEADLHDDVEHAKRFLEVDQRVIATLEEYTAEECVRRHAGEERW